MRLWTRAVRACAFAIVGAACNMTDPSPAGPPPTPEDSGRGAEAATGADVSTDARAPLPDAAPDMSLDAAQDMSLDAAQTADRSTAEAGGEGDGASSDGTMADGAVSDQLGTADAADADGKPRSPSCTVDQPCVNGDCIGQSCDQTWECFSHFAPHPCPFETVPYCGCDGKTYFFPITCAEVPYEHVGACGDGSNCDPADIRCAQPEPDCGPGKVASVVGTCYGPCVDIAQCRCVYSFECPKRDIYSCMPERHCGGPVPSPAEFKSP